MIDEIDRDLFDRVVRLVAKNRGLKTEKIKPESRLLQDLGCDGMDGDDLLAAIRDEFGVDFSGFVFERHFGQEGIPLNTDLTDYLCYNPLTCLFWKIFQPENLKKYKPESFKKIPITVLDLYEAARAKKFPDLSNRPAE